MLLYELRNKQTNKQTNNSINVFNTLLAMTYQRIELEWIIVLNFRLRDFCFRGFAQCSSAECRLDRGSPKILRWRPGQGVLYSI